MLKKTSKLHSILTGTCPRCYQESMYKFKNPYNIATIYQMNDYCGSCGLKYKIEPSFFYGAMYVSYGLTVAIGVAAFVSASFFIKMNVNQSLLIISSAIIILMPITARLSRNIYIALFVKYNPNWKDAIYKHNE